MEIDNSPGARFGWNWHRIRRFPNRRVAIDFADTRLKYNLQTKNSCVCVYANILNIFFSLYDFLFASLLFFLAPDFVFNETFSKRLMIKQN